MDNMPEETQPVETSEDKVLVEARERAKKFQEAYAALCVEHKCSHKATLNASTEGIFPSFVIAIAKDQVTEGKPEEKSAEKAE